MIKFFAKTLVICTLAQNLYSQDLYNGGFEDVVSSFPNLAGQIDKAVGWQSIWGNKSDEAIGSVDLIGNGFYSPYWAGPGTPTPQQTFQANNISFDYSGNHYIGFYSNSELAQNVLVAKIPANKIFKIRFRFGYSDMRSTGTAFVNTKVVNAKAKVYLLNHFMYYRDFSNIINNPTCNNAWKRVEKVVSVNVGQNYQSANQWHIYESDWTSTNKDITTIAVGGFGSCENDSDDYIYMDDIEIITAEGSCATCSKMNEPLIPDTYAYPARQFKS